MTKKSIFVFALFFALAVFLAHYWIVGSGVWGDGRYYYAYLRSAVVDHNLDFRNEFEHFSCPLELTKTGRIANKFSIGPALLWSPFFLVFHLKASFLNLLGINLITDGFSHLYQIATGLAAVFYGILGLWLSFKVVEEYFSLKIALISTFSLWLASNLFFYTAVDPINSHAVSFFVASAIVFTLIKYSREGKGRQLAILGLLTGLLAMIRTQDLIFLVPILAWLLKEGQKEIRLAFNKVSIFLFFVLVGFLPQLGVWQILYGELKSPYLIQGETFNWLRPQILLPFFSSNNGLFYYSPILLLAIIGLFLARKRSFLVMGGIFLFLLQTYVVASWHTWSGGEAYGGRMFISLMPFFIIGLAAFLERYNKKRWGLICSVLLALVVLNFVSIVKFLLTH